jgi:hypothetical protein
MKVPANRRGFIKKTEQKTVQQYQSIIPQHNPPLVYWQTKLSHTGITGYKTFENCFRRVSEASKANLRNQRENRTINVNHYKQNYELLNTERIKKTYLEIAKEKLFDNEYQELLRIVKNERKLNPTQSRKVKSLANKLNYYSSNRLFRSRKTGKYKFRTGFITLTAPEGSEDKKVLKAFEHFLDYLSRTANCTYVWKKELGEENKRLHFHILVNNFIPYYIVNWKWKGSLILEGVSFPEKQDGGTTNAHARIELPRSKKLIAHYISKYMSKAYALPRYCGFVYGCSKILLTLKEVVLIENDKPWDEIEKLKNSCKTITDYFLTHICVDLLQVERFCPQLYGLFQKQYIEFNRAITREQRFFVC